MKSVERAGWAGVASLRVKIVPGAKKNRVVGQHADGIKIQVSAPPEQGKANKAALQVLAEALGLKVGQLQILTGENQPRKIVAISGMDEQALQAWLAGLGS